MKRILQNSKCIENNYYHVKFIQIYSVCQGAILICLPILKIFVILKNTPILPKIFLVGFENYNFIFN